MKLVTPDSVDPSLFLSDVRYIAYLRVGSALESQLLADPFSQESFYSLRPSVPLFAYLSNPRPPNVSVTVSVPTNSTDPHEKDVGVMSCQCLV